MSGDRRSELIARLAALDAGEEVPVLDLGAALDGLAQGEVQTLRASCAAPSPRARPATAPTLAPIPRRRSRAD